MSNIYNWLNYFIGFIIIIIFLNIIIYNYRNNLYSNCDN